MKELLKLREEMKRKKPDFVRQDFHKKRLKRRWVKPRGLHSKVRVRKAGHPMKVSTGYGFPKEVRGLSKEGLKIKMVHNENELNSIDQKKEGIIISGKVALKNKISLLKKAKGKGIKVVNLNVDEYLKEKEEEIKKKLEKRKVEEEERKKVKKEKKKVEAEKLEEKLSEEEKKEQEKKEKDKLLTKREV